MAAKRKTHPAITPQRIAELSKLAKRIDREEADKIKAEAAAFFAVHESIQAVIAAIRDARVRQELTLEVVGKRSRIGKANLSRLENEKHPNPTWELLARYASAVGVKIKVGVE